MLLAFCWCYTYSGLRDVGVSVRRAVVLFVPDKAVGALSAPGVARVAVLARRARTDL